MLEQIFIKSFENFLNESDTLERDDNLYLIKLWQSKIYMYKNIPFKEGSISVGDASFSYDTHFSLGFEYYDWNKQADIKVHNIKKQIVSDDTKDTFDKFPIKPIFIKYFNKHFKKHIVFLTKVNDFLKTQTNNTRIDTWQYTALSNLYVDGSGSVNVSKYADLLYVHDNEQLIATEKENFTNYQLKKYNKCLDIIDRISKEINYKIDIDENSYTFLSKSK